MRLRVPYAADGERPHWVKLRHRRRLSAERRPRNRDIEFSDTWHYAGNRNCRRRREFSKLLI
jgi:hypothetical protein